MEGPELSGSKQHHHIMFKMAVNRCVYSNCSSTPSLPHPPCYQLYQNCLAGHGGFEATIILNIAMTGEAYIYCQKQQIIGTRTDQIERGTNIEVQHIDT